MDLRVQKTYRALFVAFTELLEEHRFEDVTVAMLCDRAMIRRTTFYKHFADKTAYFSFYVDSLCSNFVERVTQEQAAKAASVDERQAIFQMLIDFFLEHEKLMDNVAHKFGKRDAHLQDLRDGLGLDTQSLCF